MFYAIPPTLTDKEGNPTNALYWVTKTLLSFLGEYRPDYLIIATEWRWESFREALYPAYKSNRDGLPDDLRCQIAPIFELADILGIPVISHEWHEADDVIGTYATLFKEHGQKIEVKILSGDKDLYQFVWGNIYMYDPIKKQKRGYDETVEKFWLPPEHILDMLALVWDTSDCIPGVRGVWPKTAQKLIQEFGGLEAIYERINEVTWATHKKLLEEKESAFLSKKLATIITNLPVDPLLSSYETSPWDPFENANLVDFLTNYWFESLIPQEKRVVNTIKTSHLSTALFSEIDTQASPDRIFIMLQSTALTVGIDSNIYQAPLDEIHSDIQAFLVRHKESWIGYDIKTILSRLSHSSQKQASANQAQTLFS